jgi:hypothetical protein
MADEHATAIDRLVGETRVAREALHTLIIWLQRERWLWHEGAHALARRDRLTTAQRQKLCASVTCCAERRAR